MPATWVFLALLFAGVWVYAFFREDVGNPEPLWMVLLAVGAGALSFFAADRVEVWLMRDVSGLEGPLLERLRLAFLVAGPVEEAAKFLAVLLLVWPWAHCDETIDGIVYAAAAGAGFALVENLAWMKEQPEVVLARGPIGTAAHVLFSGLWGGALGFAGHAVTRLRQAGITLAGLLLALLAHGAFDAISLSAGREISMNTGRAAQIALLVACFLFLRWRIRCALRLFPFRYRTPARPDPAGG